MNIVADNAIPYIREIVNPSHNINFLDHREITRETLNDTEILMVRSVTRVNEQLLSGTPVKIVATPTSGVDHIDMPYLLSSGIKFINTPGCNSRSVAEYILSCLYVLREEKIINLSDITIGIVGCGHVGTRLSAMLEATDIRHLLYDPPLQEVGDGRDYSSLKAIQNADVISLHVPLTIKGKHPTYHLVNQEFLSGLKPGVVLINASRGEVIDENALLESLKKEKKRSVMLDVCKDEPFVNSELISNVKTFTPHIAGYSLDAKYIGARRAYEKICELTEHQQNELMPDIEINAKNNILIAPEALDDDDVIQFAVLSSYDVRIDAEKFKQQISSQEKNLGQNFNDFRKNYPVRREFTNFSITLTPSRIKCKQQLEGIGFKVNPEN